MRFSGPHRHSDAHGMEAGANLDGASLLYSNCKVWKQANKVTRFYFSNQFEEALISMWVKSEALEDVPLVFEGKPN